MNKSNERQEQDEKGENKIDMRLIGNGYSQYQDSPENYLLEKIRNNSPWPETNQADILSFLKSISALYNPVPYHNLTHAFDVMINLDSYLTSYGWQDRLGISPQKRVLMLIAAYAHDGGHEGLTNAYYKNANHLLATYSQSPLQYMHASHLRRLFREHKLEVSTHILEELTEMILRTDNYYHGWLLERGGKLKGSSDPVLRQQKNGLTICCLLLHAADLNNTCKEIELNILWTNLLYEEFDNQNKLQMERGLKPTVGRCGSEEERARSNIFFLDHMVLPLFRAIADIEPRFTELIRRVDRNKIYWTQLLGNR